MIRMSIPKFCKAVGRDPLTSANPPVLINGKTSEVANKTRKIYLLKNDVDALLYCINLEVFILF